MTVDVIRLMYGFNTWANERVLARVADLTPGQYTASGSASYSSVRDTLVHTMWGQAHWLSRWQGQGDASDYDPNDYNDLEFLRARWRELDNDTYAFIARLDEVTLNQLVHYRIRGEAFAYPLWQLMLHQVNHATQHRSEVAVILTEYGHSIGSMDMVVYLQSPSL